MRQPPTESADQSACCKAPPLPPDATQRQLFDWSLLAGVVLLAVLAGPFFAGRVYTRDDLGAYHLPVRAFYAERLAQGEPFDWMPHLYSGFYLTGEGQAGTYHPLHLFLYSYLPLRVAACWEWLISYPFMLAGTWLFLRRRLKRNDAAMFGAVLFTFSGFNLLHFLHPNAVAVVAHIPWLLWAIDIVMIDCLRRRVALGQLAIALLTGSQLLLGYPQYVWFSLLAEVAYAVGIAASRRCDAREGCGDCGTCADCVGCTSSPWGRLIIAKGCGLLIGGIQLLPTLDALTHSVRQTADANFANWGSLHPLNVLQLVAPYLFTDRVLGSNTHELGLYVGAVPLLLAVWAIFRWRRLGRLARLAGGAAAFGFVALWMAMGSYGGLYQFQLALPLVNHFRFPCRFVVLFQLAMAVLAAIGFTALVRDEQSSQEREVTALLDQRPTRWQLWEEFQPLWMVVGVSMAVALAGFFLHAQGQVAGWLAVLIGPLLFASAAVLMVLAGRGHRFALVGLILFAATDLGVYGFTYAVYPQSARLEKFAQQFVMPPAGSAGRVLASNIRFDEPGLRTGNQMTVYGWHRVDGYAGLEPQQSLDYRQLPALRAAGVRWVKQSTAAAKIPGLIGRTPQWLEVPDPLPRVRMVNRTVHSDDPARDIEQVDIDTTALTDLPLAVAGQEPGTATVVAERPGLILVQCETDRPQLLVVSESYHSGWQATVNGLDVPVVRTNGDFIGVPIRAGHNVDRVILEFRPQSLQFGWFATWCGLGLALVCFVGCVTERTPRIMEGAHA